MRAKEPVGQGLHCLFGSSLSPAMQQAHVSTPVVLLRQDTMQLGREATLMVQFCGKSGELTHLEALAGATAAGSVWACVVVVKGAAARTSSSRSTSTGQGRGLAMLPTASCRTRAKRTETSGTQDQRVFRLRRDLCSPSSSPAAWPLAQRHQPGVLRQLKEAYRTILQFVDMYWLLTESSMRMNPPERGLSPHLFAKIQLPCRFMLTQTASCRCRHLIHHCDCRYVT